MVTLGLDLGTKTLGVAISKTGIIANPYKLIQYKNQDFDALAKEVSTIVQQENFSAIALGLPKNMNNTLGFASERSMKFKEILENYVDVPITLIDERLSTVEAESILLANDMSRKKRKKKIDSLAANIILQTYLDSIRGGNYGK